MTSTRSTHLPTSAAFMDAIHIEGRHLDTWSLADARLKLEEKSLLLKKITYELGFADVPMCSDCAELAP